MFYAEFPHDIIIKRTNKTVDKTTYPPKESVTVEVNEVKGFIDPPSTSERLNYHNMELDVSRNLYAPYDVDIKTNDIIIFEGQQFTVNGEQIDQGGQHEINMFHLKKV